MNFSFNGDALSELDPCYYCVSPSPFDLDFGTLDFGTSDSGLTIK